MRKLPFALVIGTLLFVLNSVGVISGITAPPPGYEPAYYIRNLDIPQYLTWAELSKQHWLLPDYNAPWRTEPALWQPLFHLIGRSGLPIIASYYILQLAFYWIAMYALLIAAETFCTSRRAMLWASLVAICSIPPQMLGWVVAKLLHLKIVELVCSIGVVQFSYVTADGLFHGGLSNSFTLSFGTAIMLLAFVNLAKYLKHGDRKHYYWLLLCLFLDGLFHPFEIFMILAAAIWPLWKHGRIRQMIWMCAAAGIGMSPQLIQTVRTGWLRDVSDASQLGLGSPAWLLLFYGFPALMIAWLMMARFRVDRPEDEVLQSWFLASAILPCFPAIPAAHVFDGVAYCIAFLLVRKAQQDKLISRLWREKPRPMRIGLATWAAVSAAAIVTMYIQIWQDGRSANPVFLSAIASKDEVKMLGWMKGNIQRGELVLAPEDIAPWAAAIPTPSFASHDIFGISYEAQKALAKRFFDGEDVRHELIERFGVRYIIAPADAHIVLTEARPLRQEGSLQLFEVPGQELRPYPGAERIDGAKPKNHTREVVFRVFEVLRRRLT